MQLSITWSGSSRCVVMLGVKLVYLPLYSPDLNLIEEFFAKLKAFIKWNWHVYEKDPE